MGNAAEAGRRGPDVRSDCWIGLELRKSGGLQVGVSSKVAALYGRSIEEQLAHGLRALGVEHAKVEVEDSGALPFVIAARLEAAVRRALPDCKGELLPELAAHARCSTRRDRFRRSRLYVPGNEPKFMVNAGLYGADGIILDLEDSVAPPEKDAALLLVRNALRVVDFKGAERMVRINQLPKGLEELDVLVPQNVHVVLIPKCESAEQVERVEQQCRAACEACGRRDSVLLMPIVESALGALRAYEIASASPDVVALAIGLEDYTADIGAIKTAEGRESFWARAQVINAARAAGVQPIDTVFSDVGDMDGLRASAREAKALGFEGKGCIHPRQIPVVNEAFAPGPQELEKALKIVHAFEDARAKGLSVVALGTKMIDPPVVRRAQKTVSMAEEMGLLPGKGDGE